MTSLIRRPNKQFVLLNIYIFLIWHCAQYGKCFGGRQDENADVAWAWPLGQKPLARTRSRRGAERRRQSADTLTSGSARCIGELAADDRAVLVRRRDRQRRERYTPQHLPNCCRSHVNSPYVEKPAFTYFCVYTQCVFIVPGMVHVRDCNLG